MKMFFNKRAIMMSTDYLNMGQVKPRLEALNVKTEYVVFGTQRYLPCNHNSKVSFAQIRSK